MGLTYETAAANVAAADLPALSQKTFERFIGKLRQVDAHKLFHGAKVHNGYGTQRLGGRRGGVLLRAHRLIWIMHNGPIPQGKQILHRQGCIERNCCEISHLYAGSAYDNTHDMLAQSRGANGTHHSYGT